MYFQPFFDISPACRWQGKGTQRRDEDVERRYETRTRNEEGRLLKNEPLSKNGHS